ALADLEARLGLLGLAVPHYARASSLDAKILAGRGDVCGLLERRAARFYEQGEGLAADLDMRRVKELCGAEGSNARTVGGARGPDLALWKRIRALAEEQVRAQRATPRCKEKGACSELDAKADARLTAELVAAHEKGPAALRELARTGVSLAAADVVALLAAELDGDLGVDLISQDELRGWLGYAEMVDLADAMSRVSPEIAAYVRLRVEALGPSYAIPGAGQPVARSRAALISRILDNLGDDRAARGWRVLVVAGDVGAAEFELTSGLQRTGAGEAGEPRQAAVPQPEHWSARVPVTAASLDELLILARMRDRAGERAQALEITRFAAAEAHALGLAGALELSIDEARRQLAAGRPWSAMAIADALPGDRVRRVKQAAGGAISVMDAACEGGCGLQEDRAVVERVMGEAWVKQAA
ncbi:MAG: hypothetical protein KC636_37350, partial [Myxococcales bacterium]|nr:hypothetical protein [Myxococcales bacterium]